MLNQVLNLIQDLRFQHHIEVGQLKDPETRVTFL